MTTPTTNISFSSIQTEFGGANPISLSEYVKGGTYVPSYQATSGTDGNAIPTSSSGLRIGMFRGLTKVVVLTGLATGGTVAAYATPPAHADATLYINADGTITRVTSTTDGSSGLPTAWATGSLSSASVRGTLNSGSLTSGTTGTWLSLSSTRSFNVHRAPQGSASANVTFAFSVDGGATTVSSFTCTIFAQSASG